MQVPPSIELAGIIRHYLFLESDGTGGRRVRLFPDGSAGIVLNSPSTLFLNGLALPEAFFYGQITEYKELYCQGPARLVIVVFHPHGFNPLPGVPASELNDSVIPLADLFGGAGMALPGAVAVATGWEEKVRCIEDFFREMTYAERPAGDPVVATAVEIIQRHKGSISIQQLAGMIGCQSRQLERKFNTVVGLSPKHFSNMVRTLHFVKTLAKSASLTGAAYDSGYYDQAHLIREFRKMTGLTPRQYLRSSAQLTVNFLQL